MLAKTAARAAARAAACAAIFASIGCYHFAFDLPPPEGACAAAGTAPTPAAQGRTRASAGAGGEGRAGVGATVEYVSHPPTYVNGFVGTGRVDTRVYCAHPLRTELNVGVGDVLISMATLLIYTPHTLTVVCPAVEAK
jgi:hypothetical protein